MNMFRQLCERERQRRTLEARDVHQLVIERLLLRLGDQRAGEDEASGSTVQVTHYTVEQAAAVLGVNRKSVYDAVARGQLAAVRIGRLIRIPRCSLFPAPTTTRSDG